MGCVLSLPSGCLWAVGRWDPQKPRPQGTAPSEVCVCRFLRTQRFLPLPYPERPADAWKLYRFGGLAHGRGLQQTHTTPQGVVIVLALEGGPGAGCPAHVAVGRQPSRVGASRWEGCRQGTGRRAAPGPLWLLSPPW